ncbi:putative disease resistance protein At1g50180 [Henckelia pumila]|uniref:putative disease resistance protein At1g50180 n=1 Tax=Henckelia pumila TaxID=405737 RepID=UPI003C6DEB82
MAAAYASLLSLARTLRETLNLERCYNPLDKEKIVSLLEKVDFTVNFLEHQSEEHIGAVDREGNRMRQAAYEAQDFVDSYLCSISNTEACHEVITVEQALNSAREKIDFFFEEMVKMKNSYAGEDRRPITYFSSPADYSSGGKMAAKDMIVGFDDDFNAIKERIYEDSSKLQVIPIVGMGGIGKTTLARRAYDDSFLTRHFDIYASITVSAEYQRGQILSGLLHHLKILDGEQSHHQSDTELERLVYQNLKDRRYLIVIDDIWSTKAWDDLKMIFPDDGNGSRILLTTRLSDVAVYAGSCSTSFHQMSFLNEIKVGNYFRHGFLEANLVLPSWWRLGRR